MKSCAFAFGCWEVFWSGIDCELFSIVSTSVLLLANAVAWWKWEIQCLATNFAQRFLTTIFFARISLCWSRTFLWNKTFVKAILRQGMIFTVQASLQSRQKPTVLNCRPFVAFSEMGTFQKEKRCKKDFRHHFMLHYNPKVVVISKTNWFSEKFRKERLCCLVVSWIFSFDRSCHRNESYEILAFIYFRTSLTFLTFGQQMLTFFKNSKHSGILEFFKF